MRLPNEGLQTLYIGISTVGYLRLGILGGELPVLDYDGTMAGQAEPAPNQSLEASPPVPERDLVFEHAAKLYGQGWARAKIARIMVNHLVPAGKDRPLEQRLSQARAKLRRWEHTQKFRDLVYHKAVVDLDLDSPKILKGLSKKAQRGRVDAARLAFELTGRHNPKGDQTPTQVVVAINGVPRPARHTEPREVLEVEGEVVDED